MIIDLETPDLIVIVLGAIGFAVSLQRRLFGSLNNTESCHNHLVIVVNVQIEQALRANLIYQTNGL